MYDDDEGFDDSMIPYKSFKEYETNAWETGSIGGESEKSRGTSRTGQSRSMHHAVPYNGSPYGQPGFNRSQSMYSATDLPAGADYWRDSSPLGPNHSSRNLRNMPSNTSLRHSIAGSEPNGGRLPIPMGMPDARSMAGMSMWGPGSEYGGSQRGPEHAPFLHPMATGMSNPSMGMGMGMPMGPMGPMGPVGYHNPYGPPPGVPYDYLRPQSMMGPYAGAAPRNSVMSGLGSYGLGAGTRMSSYSLATTANPFMGQAPASEAGVTAGAPGLAGVQAEELVVDEREEVPDEEVLETLKKFLAGQDLMKV